MFEMVPPLRTWLARWWNFLGLGCSPHGLGESCPDLSALSLPRACCAWALGTGRARSVLQAEFSASALGHRGSDNPAGGSRGACVLQDVGQRPWPLPARGQCDPSILTVRSSSRHCHISPGKHVDLQQLDSRYFSSKVGLFWSNRELQFRPCPSP